MATVQITPSKDVQMPYDEADEDVPTLIEKLAVAGNTAELQHALGAPLEMNKSDGEQQKKLLLEVLKDRKVENLNQRTTAFAAAAFLREYGTSLAFDAAVTRAAITAKLMELANCGDPKYELRALELLGKHSDIGLFTERSEVTINYKNPEALEEAIKARVKRLLNANTIDHQPIGANLDEELGVARVTPKKKDPPGPLDAFLPPEEGEAEPEGEAAEPEGEEDDEG